VSVEDGGCLGDQAPAKWQNVEKNWELIHEDCRRTIHELADAVGISYGVCQEILTENLNMRCIAMKFLGKWSKAVAHKCMSWAVREG
jgi:hypothetical protein